MLQAKFKVPAGGFLLARTDFFWPKYRLIGEFDGDAKYLSDHYLGTRTARQAVLAEKKREDRLRAAGFRVVPWDWATASDPARFAACLRQAGLPVARSRPSGTCPGPGAPAKKKPTGPAKPQGRRCTSAAPWAR